jgi:hypothetical protein
LGGGDEGAIEIEERLIAIENYVAFVSRHWHI